MTETDTVASAKQRGAFITFEGGEGGGKSTQLTMVAQRLGRAGLQVLRVREPGGTRISDQIRALLLDPKQGPMAPTTELFLYAASRAQLVAEVIEPALAAGTTVLCDRFTDSTTAYQGHGRGLSHRVVETLNASASVDVRPDLTIVLDIDPVVGLRRATHDGADRIEQEALEFHERVRDGFLRIAAAEPERCHVIDASATVDAVADAVWSLVVATPVLAARLVAVADTARDDSEKPRP